MWVWVLRDSKGQMSRMSYKRGSYSHASIFFTEEDADSAAEYFGGRWSYHKTWLDL